MDKTYYVGLDLGTTNSTAAIFDGERVTQVQSPFGGVLTPSVVRFNAKGSAVVGDRARRFLDRDPANTHSEIKRLMGTGKVLEFPAAGLEKTPQELAALILESLRADVAQQLGFAPARAVVTVPALFEVPQSAATAEAARLAGFDKVELLQEPVASALAAGWEAETSRGSWLVYDLGGGTFDVSLLDGKDGLLRVVGHDGDNFLGGRDFDRCLVDWMIGRLAEEEGVEIRRDDPEHRDILRQLALAAEEAKIALSRVDTTSVGGAVSLEIDDDLVDVDLELDRTTLEALCAPVVERSIEVCLGLLREHGRTPEDLERVVLVGGPSVMPLIRRRVAESLATPVDGLDPMTLVAQGAAIYACSAGLDARPESTDAKTTEESAPPGAHTLWLQYPAVTAVTAPHIVGRVAERGDGEPPVTVELRQAGGEQTVRAEIEDDAFVIQVALQARTLNTFAISAYDTGGRTVPVTPVELRIMHGVTLSDPPLSRTLGVALANNRVQVYFERGVPLPARRTFSHRTIEPLVPGTGGALDIPIVQGEFERAHLCRMVGSLKVRADDLPETLPVGSDVEVTLELDRGGRLSAKARVPHLEKVFEEVAHLLVPDADPEVLAQESRALQSRLVGLQRTLGSSLDPKEARDILGRLDRTLVEAELAVETARGGDEDAGQRARRLLLDLEAEVAALEDEGKWPELRADARLRLSRAMQLVSQFGSDVERSMLEESAQGVERAIASRSHDLLRQHLKVVKDLFHASYFRHPEAWSWELDHFASRVEEATDPKAVQRILERGRQARTRQDAGALRSAVSELWKYFPAAAKERQLSHGSGIH